MKKRRFYKVLSIILSVSMLNCINLPVYADTESAPASIISEDSVSESSVSESSVSESGESDEQTLSDDSMGIFSSNLESVGGSTTGTLTCTSAPSKILGHTSIVITYANSDASVLSSVSSINCIIPDELSKAVSLVSMNTVSSASSAKSRTFVLSDNGLYGNGEVRFNAVSDNGDILATCKATFDIGDVGIGIITLNGKQAQSSTIKMTEDCTFGAEFTPVDGETYTIEAIQRDKSKAAVLSIDNVSKTITPIAIGSEAISINICRDNKTIVSKDVTITVAAASMTIDHSTLTMIPGQSANIATTISGVSSCLVEWSSSIPEAVTIDNASSNNINVILNGVTKPVILTETFKKNDVILGTQTCTINTNNTANVSASLDEIKYLEIGKTISVNLYYKKVAGVTYKVTYAVPNATIISQSDSYVEISANSTGTALTLKATIDADGSNASAVATEVYTIYDATKSIELNKDSLAFAPDSESKQLRAYKVPSNRNITDEVTWKSADDSIATVSADGTVTPHKVGKTYISATDSKTGYSTSANVYVSTLRFEGDFESTGYKVTEMELYETKQFKAYAYDTNIAVKWMTSDDTSLKITDGQSKALVSVYGKSAGNDVLSCNLVDEDGKIIYTDYIKITVNGSPSSIEMVYGGSDVGYMTLSQGSIAYISANVLPSFTTQNVKWSNSKPGVASIRVIPTEAGNNKIQVVGIKKGATTIYVTTQDGRYQACCDVYVKALDTKAYTYSGIKVDKKGLKGKTYVGDTKIISANCTITNKSDKTKSDGTIYWQTSNEKVVTLDKDTTTGSEAQSIHAVAPGTATLLLVCGNKTSKIKITVYSTVTTSFKIIRDNTTEIPDASTLNLITGDKLRIEAVQDPYYSLLKAKWKVTASKNSVTGKKTMCATVKNGFLIATKNGESTVTVTIKTGKKKTDVLTKTFKVVVTGYTPSARVKEIPATSISVSGDANGWIKHKTLMMTAGSVDKLYLNIVSSNATDKITYTVVGSGVKVKDGLVYATGATSDFTPTIIRIRTNRYSTAIKVVVSKLY